MKVLTPQRKHQIKIFGLSILLGLSVASFAYLNSLDEALQPAQTEIYVEDVDEESEELLPDVRIIKMLMNKTLEFVTTVGPLSR